MSICQNWGRLPSWMCPGVDYHNNCSASNAPACQISTCHYAVGFRQFVRGRVPTILTQGVVYSMKYKTSKLHFEGRQKTIITA